MIVPADVRAEDLNSLCHPQLTMSKFDRAYLVLHINRIVYGWNRPEGWRLVAEDREDRGASFDEFKAVLNDPEWLNDPFAMTKKLVGECLPQGGSPRPPHDDEGTM